MSLTPQQAVDDMSAMFLAVAGGYTIHWENVKKDRSSTQDPWFVYMVRHTIGQQDSLGGIGSRSFLRAGQIVVAVYTPVGNGLSESYTLAKLVTDAYEGKASPNGVWFRNVRVNEIGVDGDFHQTNVIIEFQYHEQK
jgi:hypothetical protein